MNEAVEWHYSNFTSTTDRLIWILTEISHSLKETWFSKVLSIFTITTVFLKVTGIQKSNLVRSEPRNLRSFHHYKEVYIISKKDFPSFPVIRQKKEKKKKQERGFSAKKKKKDRILWIANRLAIPVLPFEQRKMCLKCSWKNHQACNKSSFLV